ncbi:hypothetical protein DLJ53_33235 [Acuticoccus sediminis]|uniref:SnoaL-like domain-containing protein n=1 Tax=Acuticoccus sediminis TaxID=2184697 RepID=A0A8B2NF09_9HYPH|nr:nuclear transport factor 2 family protein [Acuticoccus sediminis]RAH96095.1 hypothetical protein DLJ53_33235 [Acuticoccus sediminis]
MTHLSRKHLEDHAAAWIYAWNRHDVGAVIAPFSDDATFVSPLAATLTGSATVEGRAALLAYWTTALARVPHLRFHLVSAVCDPAAQTVVVHYVSHAGGRTVRSPELMRFRGGRLIYGEAFHEAPADQANA